MSTAATVTDLEPKALTWKGQADGLVVWDQQTYNGAAELLKGIKALRDEAETHHRPVIEAAHKAHKAACDALNRIDRPLSEAERLIKDKTAAFLQAEEQKRRQLQMEAEAEARRRQAEIDRQEREARAAEEKVRAEALEREIEAREAAGAKAAEIQDVIAQHEAFEPVLAWSPPVLPPAVPVVARTVQTTSAASLTYKYSAQVVDLVSLIKAAAQNPLAWAMYLMPNESALNAVARNQKEAFSAPGCRLKKEPDVRSRR